MAHQGHQNMEDMDREMEARANRAKELLSMRYKGMKNEQEAKHARKMQLERQMIGLTEDKKKRVAHIS